MLVAALMFSNSSTILFLNVENEKEVAGSDS